jgi:hypothetical protein
MDTQYLQYQQRPEQIRQVVMKLSRLVTTYEGDGNGRSTQADEAVRELTGLLSDEQASLGIESALREIWQAQYFQSGASSQSF